MSAKQDSFTVIIMAGGKGSRMGSHLPKSLHPVAGKPILARLVEASQKAQASQIRLVISPESEKIVEKMRASWNVKTFIQSAPKGTCHAVETADVASLTGTVLITNGDHPLVEAEDLQMILKTFQESGSSFSVVTARLKNPGSFGRIIRQNGRLKHIIEAQDASHEVLQIQEVNTGIFILKASILQKYLSFIKEEKRGERFITDLVGICAKEFPVNVIKARLKVAFGTNTQEQLARATKFIFKRKAYELMKKGVIIIDPDHCYIEEDVEVKPSSVIYPGCYLRGKTKIASFCAVEPNTVLSSVTLQKGVIVRPSTFLENKEIPAFTVVGGSSYEKPSQEKDTTAPSQSDNKIP